MKKFILVCLVVSICTCFSGCVGDVVSELDSVLSDVSDLERKIEEKLDDEVIEEHIEESINDDKVIPSEEDKPEKKEYGEIDKNYEKKEFSSEKNLLDKMDASQRREVNIFLSNFSEAQFSGDFSAPSKVFFAYRHNLINNKNFNDKIYKYSGESYMGISEDLANKTIERFFGEKVDPNKLTNGYWIYKDGKFLFPAADGDQYGYDFTIAEKVTELDDGTYDVDFNIYMVDDEYSWPTSDCYYYTIEQANQKCILNYTGSAIIKPKKHNGSDTYELLSYIINY